MFSTCTEHVSCCGGNDLKTGERARGNSDLCLLAGSWRSKLPITSAIDDGLLDFQSHVLYFLCFPCGT
jgi:hypothetical protein